MVTGLFSRILSCLIIFELILGPLVGSLAQATHHDNLNECEKLLNPNETPIDNINSHMLKAALLKELDKQQGAFAVIEMREFLITSESELIHKLSQAFSASENELEILTHNFHQMYGSFRNFFVSFKKNILKFEKGATGDWIKHTVLASSVTEPSTELIRTTLRVINSSKSGNYFSALIRLGGSLLVDQTNQFVFSRRMLTERMAREPTVLDRTISNTGIIATRVLSAEDIASTMEKLQLESAAALENASQSAEENNTTATTGITLLWRSFYDRVMADENPDDIIRLWDDDPSRLYVDLQLPSGGIGSGIIRFYHVARLLNVLNQLNNGDDSLSNISNVLKTEIINLATNQLKFESIPKVGEEVINESPRDFLQWLRTLEENIAVGYGDGSIPDFLIIRIP